MTYKLNGTLVADKSGYLHESFSRLSGTITSTEVKIKPSDGVLRDRFGSSVAVGSGRIVVGSILDDDNGSNSGSAYIFDLGGNQIAKIKASDGAAGDRFAQEISIASGRIVVGSKFDDDTATGSGSAYIFDLEGTQLAKITASDAAGSNNFGRSVAVGSGRIVIGSRENVSSAFVYIFDLDGTQLAKITASDTAENDKFAQAGSVALGSGRIVVGASEDNDNGSYSGSAYIFDLNGTQLAKITASDAAGGDYFGRAVAIGSGRICVGAYGDGGNFTGAAYIFDLDGTQLAKITASDAAASNNFGRRVAVGSGRIIVGSRPDAGGGSAYIFDLDGTQLAKITSSDNAQGDFFGESVAIGSGRIVVGAYLDGDNGVDSGSAYIYKIDENYSTYLDSVIKA